MKIAILKERRADEKRCAATPDTVKKYIALGATVAVEAGGGESAAIADSAFVAAGATIVVDAATAVADAEVIFKGQRPLTAADGGSDELGSAREGDLLGGVAEPHVA